MQNEARPEVVHDEKLLDLFMEVHRAQVTLMSERRHFVSQATAAEGSGFYYHRDGARVNGSPATVEQARPWVEALAAKTVATLPSYSSWDGESAQKRLDKLEAAEGALVAAWEAVRVHELNYTGWSRFWLVTSSAGHVHASRDCTSCRNTTTYAPVPSLSGLDESAAVEVMGETLCTVCFPSAPVKPSKVTQAQALKLVEVGEEAFLAARAKFLTKASK